MPENRGPDPTDEHGPSSAVTPQEESHAAATFSICTTPGGVGKTTARGHLSTLLIDYDSASNAGWGDPGRASIPPIAFASPGGIGDDLRLVAETVTDRYEQVLIEPSTSFGRTFVAPFPVGYAARTLGVGRRQMEKLIGCGLVRVAETTERGHRRVHAVDVLALASRPTAGVPATGDLALHLAPLTVDQDPAHQRSHSGWHADAAAKGLSPKDVEDAWAGLWQVDPHPHVGAAVVGNVAGFVVALGTVTGYRHVAGRVRFVVDPPTPAINARYAGRRLKAQPGDVVQRLGAPVPS